MKYVFLTIFFAFYSLQLSAQMLDTIPADMHQLRIGTSGLFYIYEKPLKPAITLSGGIGIGTQTLGFMSNTELSGHRDPFMFAFSPALLVSSRYYYSLARRTEKGKNTQYNSSSYLQLHAEYLSNWLAVDNRSFDVDRNGWGYFTAAWGLRRHLGAGFLFEFEVRAGINDRADFLFYPHLNFRYVF